VSTWENGLPGGQYRFAPEGLEEHKARLKGAADALSAATRSGEDIALDKDAAHAVLAKAEELLTKFGELKASAATLQQMTPPSPDMASEAYNKLATNGAATVDFGTALTTQARPFDAAKSEVETQYNYLMSFVDNLRRALGVTVSGDENAATIATQAGTSKTDSGGYL
jgi:hypothetical protein